MLDLCRIILGRRGGLMVRKLFIIRMYHRTRVG